MEDIKLCEVCKKNEASETCSECGIALCFECAKEVNIMTTNPGQVIAGVTTSALKPPETKLKVCPKCIDEVDFL